VQTGGAEASWEEAVSKIGNTWMKRAKRGCVAAGVIGMCAFLMGCGTGVLGGRTGAGNSVNGATVSGTVLGGMSGVAGARVRLYAVGTQGYGSAATDLLGDRIVLTDANGRFSVEGLYTCPTASTLVYVVALGGNPGKGTNSNSALLRAVGTCASVAGGGMMTVNELTSVASVYALRAFFASADHVGAPAEKSAALGRAFGTAARLMQALDAGDAPAGEVVYPVAAMRTLADVMATCVESTGGEAGDGSACGTLFGWTGGSSTKDTLAAVWTMASFPGRHVKELLGLVQTTAPYVPMATGMSDLSLVVRHRSGLVRPGAAAMDASGRLWVLDEGVKPVHVLDASGQEVSGAPFVPAAMAVPKAMAMDAQGDAWMADGSSNVVKVTPQFAATSWTVKGLQSPVAVAVASDQSVWVADGASATLTTFPATDPSKATSVTVPAQAVATDLAAAY